MSQHVIPASTIHSNRVYVDYGNTKSPTKIKNDFGLYPPHFCVKHFWQTPTTYAMLSRGLAWRFIPTYLRILAVKQPPASIMFANACTLNIRGFRVVLPELRCVGFIRNQPTSAEPNNNRSVIAYDGSRRWCPCRRPLLLLLLLRYVRPFKCCWMVAKTISFLHPDNNGKYLFSIFQGGGHATR